MTKPKDFKSAFLDCAVENEKKVLFLGHVKEVDARSAARMRALAEWLLQAADWLEKQK